MRSDEKTIQRLVSDVGWSEEAATISMRAGFRCEYCGLDFLESPENYKQWQRDHIIPDKKAGQNDLDNLAVACETCNVRFKWRWDPREYAGANASRDQLVKAVQRYILEKKDKTRQELEKCREIIGKA